MNFRKLLHWLRQAIAWLFWPALAVVVWGELSHHAPSVNIWDKYLHFTAYFGLALMATIAMRANRRALWWALALIVLGGVLEIIQGYTGRDADLFDEIANTLGVIAGVGLGWAGVAFLKARKLVEDEGAD